ncbi:hypothetical protein ACFFU5_15080, partial [Pseudofulvimonas gallinarii]
GAGRPRCRAAGLAGSSSGMDTLAERVHDAITRLRRWRRDLDGNGDDDAHPPSQAQDGEPGQVDEDEAIRWYELSQRGFRFSLTPLNVAGPLAQFRAQSRAAWIHTSATLAVAGDFDLFRRRMGLPDAPVLALESPSTIRSSPSCTCHVACRSPTTAPGRVRCSTTSSNCCELPVAGAAALHFAPGTAFRRPGVAGRSGFSPVRPGYGRQAPPA